MLFFFAKSTLPLFHSVYPFFIGSGSCGWFGSIGLLGFGFGVGLGGFGVPQISEQLKDISGNDITLAIDVSGKNIYFQFLFFICFLFLHMCLHYACTYAICMCVWA